MLPETRLHMRNAFERGDDKALEALFATDPEAESILHSHLNSALVRLAAVNGSVEFLRWLIARGADPNAIKDSLEIMTALHGYGQGKYPPSTPLFEAVRCNNRENIEALLQLGARPDLVIENPPYEREEKRRL